MPLKQSNKLIDKKAMEVSFGSTISSKINKVKAIKKFEIILIMGANILPTTALASARIDLLKILLF